MSTKNTLKFPGDSDCNVGVVIGDDGDSHVCDTCSGKGCKPRAPGRVVRARQREKLRELSGSVVLIDQKGRAVFVDLEKGTAYVQE